MDFSYWNLSFHSFAFQSENDLGSEKEMETSPAKISLYLIIEVCRADSLNQMYIWPLKKNSWRRRAINRTLRRILFLNEEKSLKITYLHTTSLSLVFLLFKVRVANIWFVNIRFWGIISLTSIWKKAGG